MTMARGAATAGAPLELLQPQQELAASAPGDHDDARRIDEVSPPVDDRVHADLTVGRDDVEAIDDGPLEARALADRGVVHDDRVLDQRALVDPDRAAEDRVADGGALDERRLPHVHVVDLAADEARRRPRVLPGANRPPAVVAVEARRGTGRAATVTSAPDSSWNTSIWLMSMR